MEVTETVQPENMNHDPGLWRCLVCSKPSNYIHVLPCEHKFCANCLRLWAMIYMDMYRGVDKEFPCQICWKQYSVPVQGLQAFEQDYKIRVLEQSLEHLSMDQCEVSEPQQALSTSSGQCAEQVELATSSEQCIDQVELGCTFPSMLSHMAPPPVFEPELNGNMKTAAPDYCVRSRHMYAHMI